MPNQLVLCGGTGAHVGVAWLRLHTLGYALGYFREPHGKAELPDVHLLDQDVADGDSLPTAHQTVRRLLAEHPARSRWDRVRPSAQEPRATQIHPVPVGPDPHKPWFEEVPLVGKRFEGSSFLPLVAQDWQLGISFDRGMMASPALGSLLFRLKDFDEQNGRNHDRSYEHLVRLPEGPRTVVVGSGVGGTGAAVGPTLADLLASRGHRVMAVMVLNWFKFGEAADPAVQERAASRNRTLEENGASALRYYHDLGREVAAVPVGTPSAALVRRVYTGDMQQPMEEVYLHAVAAIAAFHHFTAREPYGPGLYVSGALDPARLDARTPIPGNAGDLRSLQDLANRAATLGRLVEATIAALRTSSSRVPPAITAVLAPAGVPRTQVASELQSLRAHYEEQQRWLRSTLGIEGTPSDELDLERAWRARLAAVPLQLQGRMSPPEVASELWHWIAAWITDHAERQGVEPLVIEPQQRCDQIHWPEAVKKDAPGVTPGVPGQPRPIKGSGILERFVAEDRLSPNGWPHPLAMHGWFRDALRRSDPVALRQLELLLLGIVSGKLALVRPRVDGSRSQLSLERLFQELTGREDGSHAGVGQYLVVHADRPQLVYGCTSPSTLVCPVPYLRDKAGVEEPWQSLFEELTGISGRFRWSQTGPDTDPGRWRNADVIRVIRHWIEELRRRNGSSDAPPWTRAFARIPAPTGKTTFHQLPIGLDIEWAPEPRGKPPWVRIPLPSIGRRRPAEHELEWTLSADEAVSKLTRQTDPRWTVTNAAGTTFTRVTTKLVGDRTERNLVWREHLDELRDRSMLDAWYEVTTRDGVAVGIEWIEGSQVRRALLRDHEVLDEVALAVGRVRPIGVDPVDVDGLRAVSEGGSSRPVEVSKVLLPDLPLRARYLPLLRLDGPRTVDAAAENQADPRLAPQRASDGTLRWSLELQGRTDRVSIQCQVDGPGLDERSATFKQEALRAHWLVWPRFRVDGGAPWKAYYTYFGFAQRGFRAGLVWLDRDRQLRLLDDHLPGPHPRAAEEGMRPVNFDASGHAGGPPIAVVLMEETRGGLEERGLYWVPLARMQTSGEPLFVAIDFGTSHSAAAWGRSETERHELPLGPDLDKPPASFEAGRASSRSGVTLHVAESHSLLVDQLLDQGVWFPTYAATGTGVVASEFLLQRRLDELLTYGSTEGIRSWRPGQDYQLAPLSSGRSDRPGERSQYLLTDFKWRASNPTLNGRESELRKVYMSTLLELVIAEITSRRNAAAPGYEVSFLWSLRSDESQLESFQSDATDACRRAGAATGASCGVYGYYNESEAARMSQGDGRLCVVADLGGGTLDLFVSVDDHSSRFQKVVDSVKLGGNVLLDRLAAREARFLPEAEPWHKDGPTLLRAWMRTLGARKLYGDAEGDFRLPLGKQLVPGYSTTAEDQRRRSAAQAATLRYFRLIYEYIARYVVSYLVSEGLAAGGKGVHLDSIVLLLRGKGWGLHPGFDPSDSKLASLSATVRGQVEARTRALLQEQLGDTVKVGFADTRGYHTEDPKRAPVKRAVQRRAPPLEDLRGSRSYSLVELQYLPGEREEGVHSLAWTARVPLATNRCSRVELPSGRIVPAIPLTEPGARKTLAISGDLPTASVQRINEHLRSGKFVDNGLDYLVRPPRFVWEEVFQGASFLEGLEP